MSLDENPLEGITKGVVKGVLEFGADQIKSLVARFKNRQVAFIEDPETISLVVSQRKSEELKIYKEYIRDKKLQIIAQMGITLRKLEKDPLKVKNLREKIRKKYASKGLHIAQTVQNNILTTLIALLVQNFESRAEVQEVLNELLEDIEKYVIFVRAEDDAKSKKLEIVTRLNANLPPAMMISGYGPVCTIVREIEKTLKPELHQNYSIISLDDSSKITLIIIKKNILEGI